MGLMETAARFETLRVRQDGDIVFLQIHRPDANNSINDQLIEEFTAALAECESSAKIVVVQGLPEVFCYGADFKGIQQDLACGERQPDDPAPLYDLWLKLATGPFLTIAHVRGKVNAGGLGFVSACDIVLCDQKATFGLSELLFGLMPACVLPFLVRRIGRSRANVLTLMTQPIGIQQALDWGLADAAEENSENLVRKHLLRLRRLNKTAISRYKRYMSDIDGSLTAPRSRALAANREIFSDRENLEKIAQFVTTGKFPWE